MERGGANGGEYAKYVFPRTAFSVSRRGVGRERTKARRGAAREKRRSWNRFTRLVKILVGRKFLVTRGTIRASSLGQALVYAK